MSSIHSALLVRSTFLVQEGESSPSLLGKRTATSTTLPRAGGLRGDSVRSSQITPSPWMYPSQRDSHSAAGFIKMHLCSFAISGNGRQIQPVALSFPRVYTQQEYLSDPAGKSGCLQAYCGLLHAEGREDREESIIIWKLTQLMPE